MEKKYLIPLVILVSISFVVGAWIFIIQGNGSVQVLSIQGYQPISLTFDSISINTTTASAKNSTIEYFAYNKAGNFNVSILETYIDESGGDCENGQADCSTAYWLYDGLGLNQMFNNVNIAIPYNTNQKFIQVNLTCVAYTCPQRRDFIVRLTEV